nr:HERV-H LTR-associating protein 1 [Oryctolagus cuniculus]
MLGFLLQCSPGRLCVGLTCVLTFWNTVSGSRGEIKREKGMTFLPATASGLRRGERKEKVVVFLATTELPARSVDLSTLNLTELVNGMVSRALKESKKFFSLLSVTSYSSFAFHKLSVAIYNSEKGLALPGGGGWEGPCRASLPGSPCEPFPFTVSNLKAVDPAKFPTRYCYCLNNQTNDLSDFTALLVDIIGNSTSYLTEIFKSTSILSVSQTNESDCIFICVMTGKSGRNLSDFWELAEKSPVINYTFTSGVASVLGGATRVTARTPKPTTKSQQTLPSQGPPHWAWSTLRPSAPSRPQWMKTTTVSEGEASGTWSSAPHALPTTATWSSMAMSCNCHFDLVAIRRVSRTPWVTANRQTWAQTIHEKKPGGPPWEALSSTLMSTAGDQEATNTTGPLELPAGMATPTSPASGKRGPLQGDEGSSSFNLILGTSTIGTQTTVPTKAPAPKEPHTGDLPVEWPFIPREESILVPAPHRVSRCPQPLLKEVTMTATPLSLAIQKLSPCLMELCHFFQQCLCMSQRNSKAEVMRYCLEHYSWFLKNATFVCPRVKRVPHSHSDRKKMRLLKSLKNGYSNTPVQLALRVSNEQQYVLEMLREFCEIEPQTPTDFRVQTWWPFRAVEKGLGTMLCT